MKVTFKLGDGFASIRHALPGGREIALNAGGSHSTDDSAEIRALDAHHALKRATPVRKPRKPRAKNPRTPRAKDPQAAAPAGEEATT